MTVVRDPAFWKRFSIAVHLDEEASTPSSMRSPDDPRPVLKHSESWLTRETKKKQRNKYLLCGFALIFTGIIVAIVCILVWLSHHGWFVHQSPGTTGQ
ncbi:MAG: hypothetical protein MMC33_009682 [Icmadophila ericetorum]|nr:hypothetical protein [Icmadophila ericetorum]